MLLSLILTILSFYLAWQCGRSVFGTPFALWTGLVWVNAVMGVVLAVLGVFSAIRMVKGYRAQMAKAEEQQKKEMEKLHAKRRSIYLDEDIDIEALADEAAAKAARGEESVCEEAPCAEPDGEDAEFAETADETAQEDEKEQNVE